MNRFLKLLLVMLAFGCTAGRAQTYSYVNLVQADGTITQVDAIDLEITFVDNQLVATTNSGTVQIALSDMDYLEFSNSVITVTNETTDGISAATLNDDDDVEIFTASGVRVNQSLSALRPGLYLVRQGSRTIKIVRK